jgi:tetratricopeptide (TPR) repeat protein
MTVVIYNIGLIHTSNGKHGRALEYYYQALKRNPSLPQALNNIAVIYHYAEQATENINRKLLNYYMIKLRIIGTKIRLAPTNYLEAQAWLRQRDTEMV